jgi:Tol biopolymer transport system component
MLLYESRSTGSTSAATIYVSAANGSTERAIKRAGAPAWSPDGRSIAFIRSGEIFRANAQTRATKRITRTPWAPTLPIEIRDTGGQLLRSIKVGGDILDLDLSGSVLAVLRVVGGGRQLALYSTQTGEVIATTPVSASEISSSGRRVAFVTRGRIRVFSAHDRRTRTVARTTSAFVGLSFDRGRITWAENVGKHGRVRTIIPR